MKPIDYLINLILSIIMIVGVYQFYFLTQRHPLREARIWHSPLDERIPFMPSWAWIYSFLYYPAILYLNLIVTYPRQFTVMAFSFMLLLLMQMTMFWLFPVGTPAHWRHVNTGQKASERFLQFVQKFDQSTNCFPSMHVSVATLTALHAQATLGPAAYAFPVLIALSCVFAKQHYLVDLPFGALLGWVAYQLYQLAI